MKFASYIVDEHNMYACQIGESYDFNREDGQPENLYSGESLDEAMDVFMRRTEELKGYHNIIRTKRGLDTVEYKSVEVCGFGADENAEEIEYFESLDDEMRKRMEDSQRSYWDYLDYKDDEYHGIGDDLGDIFQEHELDAFLGEPDDFDVEAIIEEATGIDYRTGNRHWMRNIDLNDIAERNRK